MAKRIKIKGTPPSSTRKKLVKEGNRKFIGPRRKMSEDAEYRKGTAERGEYDYLKKKKKLRAPMARKLADRFGDSQRYPEYGGGSISKNDRLLKMLYDLGAEFRGGGQEFDD